MVQGEVCEIKKTFSVPLRVKVDNVGIEKGPFLFTSTHYFIFSSSEC